MATVGLLLSIVIGITLGLLGGGGSILAVPVFVYVLGLEAKLAIAASLGVVGAATLVGAVGQLRLGQVDLRAGLLFAVGSALGAYGGAWLAQLVTGRVQLIVFSAIMLVVAWLMLARKEKQPPAPDVASETASETAPESRIPAERARSSAYAIVSRTLPSALGVGVLTGFVGVGGGFLIVPALVLASDVQMRRAIGTSLMVITINSAVGFVGYLRQPAIVEAWRRASIEGWELTPYLLIFTAVAMAGVIAGAMLARRTRPTTLRRAFGGFLLLVGLAMLVKSGLDL